MPSDLIRTPDQRLRVFVSSTLAELAPEREAVERAIRALALTPVMFELGARPYAPRELYRAYLAQSDIFVGLYWQRYGWVGPDMDISGLEDELRLSGSLPRLLYVKAPAPEREPGLTRMLDEIREKGTEAYRSFRTPRELGRLVRDDLAILLSERFLAGAAGDGSPASSVTGPRPAGPRARSIPGTSTSLIGRDDEIEEVAALLTAPDTRLVTLVGPGGVGKTRLAIAVAERLDTGYPRGVTYLALGSISQPELVMPRIASAVGASMEGARSPLEAVAESLGDTPTLLVLDELERVAGIAPELDALLARCQGLRILATSRTLLRIRAEHGYPVPPLVVPESAEPPSAADVAALPAIRLFVERAQAARHGFTLSDENAPAIAAICRRLDGLPLAIELAAARTRLLDPGSLLERLGSSLDALGTGPVDLPERQRTLRATIGWSFELLSADELAMVATLSVFADGWTLEAATEVSGLTEDRTLDLIDVLASQSLVTIEPAEAGPRFRMATTIRELASERLAARDDHAAIEARHAAHFRTFVEGSDWPSERQTAWAARIGREEANIGSAVRWYLDHDVRPLPHLLRVLWLYWQARDRMPEGYAWIGELQERMDELDERGQAELQLVAAITAVEVGDDAAGLAAAAALERLRPGIDDPFLRSATELAMSWVRPLGDDLAGALQAANAAAEGFRRQGHPLLGWAELTVGLLEMTLDRPALAEPSLREAQELGRRYDNRWLQTAASAQLALLAALTGRIPEACASLGAIVDSDQAGGLSTQGLTFALVASARLALAEGDPARAATATAAAAALRDRAGTPAWPSRRRAEARLDQDIASRLEPSALSDARAAGARLDRAGAIALVRDASAA